MGKGKLKRQRLADYNYCCAACGCSDQLILQLDRAIPGSLGGCYDYLNTQILCAPCNLRKGDVDMGFALQPIKPVINNQAKVDRARADFYSLIDSFRLGDDS